MQATIKKRVVPFFVAAFLIFLVLLFWKVSQARLCFRENCLRVELALTSGQREKGLMYRRHLAEDRGMLFVFPNDDFWGFWMKNTYIPLDIIWLDKDMKIVDMVENARPIRVENPPNLTPAFQARFVLEANAGFVKKHRIKIGDAATFHCLFSSNRI